MDKKRILIVDDSPNEIRILMELLKDQYAVTAATDGLKAIDIVDSENKPDLILLDVTMEPLDGYETCQRIIASDPNLPIIFVSANTETDEILKGFEVGGYDYITKPIQPDILTQKVKVALEQVDQRNQLEQAKNSATDMAMSALQNVGNLSVVFGFFREALKLENSDVLAQLLIETFNQYHLDASIRVGTNCDTVYLSNQGFTSQFEEELLERSVHMNERIFEKDARLIINYGTVSIIVKNMPVEDTTKRGELKDYLTILVENSHLINKKILFEHSETEKLSNAVGDTLSESNQALQQIEAFQKDHKVSSVKIMDDLLAEVETSLFSMGLTEEQEEVLIKIIQSKIKSMLDHIDEGLKVDEQLRRITDKLGQVASMV